VVRPFDDHELAAREGRLHVSAAHLPVRDDLARGQRRLHVQARGQRLVVDVHRAQGGGEDLAILRRDQGDRLAHVPDDAVREHGPVALDHGDEVLAGDVGRGERGVYAGHRARGADVEALHARVGVRRAHDARHQRPRHRHVFYVEGAALDLGPGVGARDPLADDHARLMGRESMNERSRTFKPAGGGD
jgi:hypothetical protein